MVTTGVETQTGDLTHRKETTKGAGFGSGGNVVGAQYGRAESTKIGDDVGVTKSTTGTAGITGEGKLQVGGERKQEVKHGVKPDGTPITTTKATSGSIVVDPNSIGGNLGQSYTGKGGTTVTGGAGFTMDDKGNSNMSLTGGVTSKGGHGASVTISSGRTVTADDPEEVSPGVWEVRFVIGDTSSVGAGGTVKGPGMLGGGVSGSVTNADNKTGTRRFKTEKEAKDFKDNAAERIAKDGSIGFFPVTTIPGALAIPIGESRGVGESTTKAGSVSGTLGATHLQERPDDVRPRDLGLPRQPEHGPRDLHDHGLGGQRLGHQRPRADATRRAARRAPSGRSPTSSTSRRRRGPTPSSRSSRSRFPPMTGARRVSVRTLNTAGGPRQVLDARRLQRCVVRDDLAEPGRGRPGGPQAVRRQAVA